MSYYRDRWWVLVNAVLEFCVPQDCLNIWRRKCCGFPWRSLHALLHRSPKQIAVLIIRDYVFVTCNLIQVFRFLMEIIILFVHVLKIGILSIFLSWKQTSLLENAILYSRHSAGVGLVGTRRLVAHIPPTAAASSRRPSAMFRTYPAHRLSVARILRVPGCGLSLGFLRSTIKVK